MSTTQPLKKAADIRRIKEYYRNEDPNPRNSLLIAVGLNTALRIGDILELRCRDVYSYGKKKLKTHLSVHEQKTGKTNRIYMNLELQKALSDNIDFERHRPEDWLFPSGKYKDRHLSRYQAFRIIRNAGNECNVSVRISPHSLRKTFGYQAWTKGADPVVLMMVYNHSSFQITRRYLGLDQEEKDDIFRLTCL